MRQRCVPGSSSVLIPVVAGLGNALMAEPMVRRLKEAWPDCRIVVVAANAAMGEVFIRGRRADDVRLLGRGLGGAIQMFRHLRRERFDWCIVPFPSNRWQYNFFIAACGARRGLLHRYPMGHWRTMAFVRANRIPAQRGIHDVEQNLSLLREMEIDPGPIRAPRFDVGQTDRAAAVEALEAIGFPHVERPIVVHAGSAKTIYAAAKRWPPESYARLVERLTANFGRRILLVEGPDEVGVAQEINQRCRESGAYVLRLTGPLGVAAAVLESAQFYVGSDSGLAHLAAAVGRPAVTIFAPADPDRVCPFGCRDLVVQPTLRAGSECAPCLQYPWKSTHPKMLCHEPYCVTGIAVEAVAAAADRAARRTASPVET